jgi:hypothetical protein
VGKQWHHVLRVGKQLLVGHAADVRSQLLVEELLELERALPLRRILRIEWWLRPALLDRGDDSRRSPIDRPSRVSTGVVDVLSVRRLAFKV